MWLSSIGNFAHTVGCLQYWLPTVFTNGTIGNNGINNGTIGRTLNDIGIPLVPLVEPWTHAMFLKDASHATFLSGVIPSYKPSCMVLHLF